MAEYKKITSEFQIIKSKGTTVLIAENEEEEDLLANDITKTIVSKVNRLSKTNNISINAKSTRNSTTLKFCCDKYLEFKNNTSSKKVMMKYNQAVDYLYIYYSQKYPVNNITVLAANDFREFLLKVPSRWKSIEELKGKDLKVIINNSAKKDSVSAKILNKYPVQSLKTVDEIIVKAKTIFTYLEGIGLINKSPFKDLKKIGSKLVTEKREYKISEVNSILTYLENKNKAEEYNYVKFLLMTGLRRGESLLLKVSDYNQSKGYIDLNITGKTVYAKRIVIIHKDLKDALLKQLKGKYSNDYIFFNSSGYKIVSREEKIGTEMNGYFKNALGKEIKKYVDMHSFRKNYAQEVFMCSAAAFKELEYKTLIGHSTSNDITDKHYLRGKRDYVELQSKLDKVDFSDYFNK